MYTLPQIKVKIPQAVKSLIDHAKIQGVGKLKTLEYLENPGVCYSCIFEVGLGGSYIKWNRV